MPIQRDTGRSHAIVCRLLTRTFAASVALHASVAGADTHTWVGGSGQFWQTPANWTPIGVPADNDSAILSEPTTVFLSNDTARLASLYLSSGAYLTSNGNYIPVAGTTTLVSDGTVLKLKPTGSSGLSKTIDTERLRIQSGAELRMDGGKAEIDDDLRIASNGGLITGHGRIEIGGAQAAALAGVNGEMIVEGGTLRIIMTHGGSMSLPADIDIIGDGARLRLDGALYAALSDVRMGSGGRLTVSEDWTLGHELDAGAGQSTIDGAGRATFAGELSGSWGDTAIASESRFPGSGRIFLHGHTLELDGPWTCLAGHDTEVRWGGELVINEYAAFSPSWDGDVLLNGGRLVANELVWLDGQLTMDTWGGVHSRIQGSNWVWLTGTSSIIGDEAYIDADFEAAPGSVLNVVAGSTLVFTGEAVVRHGSSVVGAGRYVVGETGRLRADPTAVVGSDLANDGTVAPGPPGPAPTGRLVIGRDYVQSATGALAIELAGALASEADRLDVGGDAMIRGALEVALVGGYEPDPGTTFTVLSADSITGEFDAVTGPAGMRVDYLPTQVRVTFEEATPCAADVDGDGAVGVLDLLEVLADWGSCAGCASDIDGDDMVGVLDLLEVLAGWGACP